MTMTRRQWNKTTTGTAMKNNRVSSRRGDPRRHHLRDTMTTTTTTTRLLIAATVSACLLSVVTAQGTDLGGGIVARTNVQQYANLATDVRDIQQLLAEGGASSSPEALNIYQQGRNADSRPGVKLSLQSLTTSLDPTSTSSSTPAYLTHLFGLADQDTTALSDHTLYADDYVRTQLSSGTAQSTDAIVALQMWMYGTHLLFTGIDTCRKMIAADNPSIFDLGGGGMDEFIALWIGEGQRPGNKNNDGHALYAMTQRAADLYSLAEPEAPANSNIKLLYNEGASALSFPNACTKENDETLGQLWSVAQRIVSQMTVPLLQLLIDALVTRDTEATRLYALAVVPQMAQCRPSTYKRLQERLLDGTATINRVDEIIRDIQSMTDCLGFQCSDLGVHKGGEVPGCQDVSPITPLAEYTPTTAVHPHAKIDLDVLQIKQLTSMQSYEFAKMLYLYGKNSPVQHKNDGIYQLRTLHNFATNNNRALADPFYTDFERYHNDPNYADTIIQQTLNNSGKWGSTASVAQRTRVVADTLAYQVLYMHAMVELGGALESCQDKRINSSDGGIHEWDEVAAYLIGSLEGTAGGGSVDLQDGQLVWSLANQRAFQFQTENEEGFSKINSDLEELLFAGRAQINRFDCVNLQKTAVRIQHLVLLPFIQNTLRYAITNANLQATSTSRDLAAGETAALSVLPIVQKYDAPAAGVIEQNMIIRNGVQPVAQGPQAVADAFYQALDEFGYSCSLVGATQQVDACSLAGGLGSVNGNNSGNDPGSMATMLRSWSLVTWLPAVMGVVYTIW